MLLTLEACLHVKVAIYGDVPNRGTCLTCYARLRAVEYRPATRTVVWLPDTPVAVCNHPDKKPIPDSLRRKPYQDALCLTCGSVLRHPNGPGSWREVIFNGLVIKEEPF